MSKMEVFYQRLNELPARARPLPRMTPSNPQEQLEQYPIDWTLIESLSTFAFTLADVVEMPTQIAPPGSRALTLGWQHASQNRNAFMVDFEFAHIHNPPIGSMHLTLPIQLRDLAIERQWALRHPLAVQSVVSPDVAFVYAPRDAGELQVAKLLLGISHNYAHGFLIEK